MERTGTRDLAVETAAPLCRGSADLLRAYRAPMLCSPMLYKDRSTP